MIKVRCAHAIFRGDFYLLGFIHFIHNTLKYVVGVVVVVWIKPLDCFAKFLSMTHYD